METVKFCPSAFTVCLENPEPGGVLLVVTGTGATDGVGVEVGLTFGVGAGVGVGVGMGEGEGVGIGVALDEATWITVGTSELFVTFWENVDLKIIAEDKTASIMMIATGAIPSWFKNFIGSYSLRNAILYDLNYFVNCLI